MPLVDDIATALEVSHGTACKIAKLTKLPDRAKSIREDSYWRKVAKVCKRHDITAGRILELASKRKRGRVPVPVGADAGTQARAPHAGDEPGGRHELGSFEASLESLRLSVATIGAAVSSNGTEDRTDLQLIDRYAKLQSELRQSEKEWLALQKEYALIFRRGDVYETTSTLWVAFRAAIDSLMSQITESTNLPAWLEEMGGSIGDEDQRTFAAIVRDKAYKLLSPRINEMSDALRATATPAVPDGLSAECRKELAAELRRVAAQLEGDERWARE